MCMELFVASDQPIELSHGWRGQPYLTVQEVADTDIGIRRHLTLPYLRHLGAHTGCSCGFKYGQPNAESTPEEEAAGRQSVAALHDFLKTQLSAGASLQLLSRWFTEAFSPVEASDISIGSIGGDSFDLPENAVWNVRP